MVISAPWLSRAGGGVVNVRGVAITLALGRFLKSEQAVYLPFDSSFGSRTRYLGERPHIRDLRWRDGWNACIFERISWFRATR